MAGAGEAAKRSVKAESREVSHAIALCAVKRHTGRLATSAFLAFGLVVCFVAHVSPLMAQTQHSVHHKKSVAKAAPAPEPAPAAPVEPVAPLSMLEEPAVPATIKTARDSLMVKAENSSLTQILHQVSSETGMKLDGLGGDERVFGSFGPGAPRDVLTALLNGTAYNVVMVGGLPNGTPRELLLTRRDGSAAKSAAPNVQHGSPDEDAPVDDSGSTDDADEPPPPPPLQTVPQGQPVPQGVRTPQQWQQLQQMRNLPTSAPPE